MSPSTFPTGEIAALGAAFLWATSTILWTRQMQASWPQAMNLFKTGFCLPLFIATLLVIEAGSPLRGVTAPASAILVLSGVIGMSLGDSAYFAALPRIGARRTMLVQCLTPLFAAILSAAAGQPLPRPIAGFGVLLVLIGLVLVLKERPLGMIEPGHLRDGIFFAGSAT